MPYYIYKFFNSERNLLYIGHTANPFNRFAQHKAVGGWRKDSVAHIEIAEVNNKSDLNLYEVYLINHLRPIYNVSSCYGIEPSIILPELDFKPYTVSPKCTMRSATNSARGYANFYKKGSERISPTDLFCYHQSELQGLRINFTKKELVHTLELDIPVFSLQTNRLKSIKKDKWHYDDKARDLFICFWRFAQRIASDVHYENCKMWEDGLRISVDLDGICRELNIDKSIDLFTVLQLNITAMSRFSNFKKGRQLSTAHIGSIEHTEGCGSVRITARGLEHLENFFDFQQLEGLMSRPLDSQKIEKYLKQIH